MGRVVTKSKGKYVVKKKSKPATPTPPKKKTPLKPLVTVTPTSEQPNVAALKPTETIDVQNSRPPLPPTTQPLAPREVRRPSPFKPVRTGV